LFPPELITHPKTPEEKPMKARNRFKKTAWFYYFWICLCEHYMATKANIPITILSSATRTNDTLVEEYKQILGA
jgi:hypothetical protein